MIQLELFKERKRSTEFERDYPNLCDVLREEIFNDLPDDIEFSSDEDRIDLVIHLSNGEKRCALWKEIEGWTFKDGTLLEKEELYDVEKQLAGGVKWLDCI